MASEEIRPTKFEQEILKTDYTPGRALDLIVSDQIRAGNPENGLLLKMVQSWFSSTVVKKYFSSSAAVSGASEP